MRYGKGTLPDIHRVECDGPWLVVNGKHVAKFSLLEPGDCELADTVVRSLREQPARDREFKKMRSRLVMALNRERAQES